MDLQMYMQNCIIYILFILKSKYKYLFVAVNNVGILQEPNPCRFLEMNDMDKVHYLLLPFVHRTDNSYFREAIFYFINS